MTIKIDCDSHFLPHDAFDNVDPRFFDRGPHFVFDAEEREVVVYKARAEQIPHFMWNYPTCLNLGKRYAGVWDGYARSQDVPLIIHCSHLAITAGAHRYQRYRFGNALQFPAESALAVGSLICGGVLDAFPRLRVGILESGAGFVPYLFDRLDEVSVEEPEYT